MDGRPLARPRVLIPAALAFAVLLSIAAATLAGAQVPWSDEEPTAQAAAPRTPQLLSPADDATVEAIGAFSWRAARGAVQYEFQVAADPNFESIVGGSGSRRASYKTKNTFATVDQRLPDGTYYWRVRGIDRRDRAGRWSSVRSLVKSWSTRAQLLGPDPNEPVVYPTRPLLLRWSRVAHAQRYLVTIATDPSLAFAVTSRGEPVDTQANVLSLSQTLAPGRYYWGVTPVDARGHRGRPSEVSSFTWTWPTQTTARIADVNPEERIYEPEFSWDPIPGAAEYEVEVNHSQDFAVGSKVCCDKPTTTATLHAPPKVFANNTYYWRVRALDLDGNAGVWNFGPSFQKDFDPVTATNPTTIRNLHVRDNDSDPSSDLIAESRLPDANYPVVVWDPVPGASSYEVVVAPEVLSGVQQCEDGADNETIPDGLADFPDDPDCTSPVDNREEPGSPATPSECDDGIDNDADGTVDHPQELGCESDTDVEEENACNWTSPAAFDIQTATAAWTPLAPFWNNVNPVGESFNRGVSRDSDALVHNLQYCVRVRARADRDGKNEEVLSDWTQLNGQNQPSFDWKDAKPVDDANEPLPANMKASDYVLPQTGTVTSQMPLLTWKPIDWADSYFVIVAKDASFTEIADVALTEQPTYAPRFRAEPWTYSDETTAYYWAVLPAARANGNGVTTAPEQNAPRTFHKQSTPPDLVGPADGSQTLVQPTFRWTFAHGAREYRLQVAQDPTFGDPIEDIVTNSTSYTSSANYPADTLLYWRVRANDERKVGLTWSRTATFRRGFPAPEPSSSIPEGGETIPPLDFSHVQGAVSYDLHVDQVDGTDRTFTIRSPIFTPVTWYGNGVWHFQIRANFKAGNRIVPGPWSRQVAFARRLGTPAGAHAIRQSNRVLVSWEPVIGAKEYKVEIATSDSFNKVVESKKIDGTDFAPRLNGLAYEDGGPLYYRVTPFDDGGNQGGAAAGQLRSGKPLRLTLRGRIRRGRTTTVIVKVTDRRRRPVRGAKVQVRGVANVQPRSTSRRGTVRLRVRAVTRGRAIFRAVKTGYRTAEKTVRVR